MASKWMAGLKRDDFAADCGSAATQFPLPILDRQRCSLRCQYRNRQRPSFAADSLIGSDVVSAAGFRIGNDAAIAMESGWIAGTNKRLVLANGI